MCQIIDLSPSARFDIVEAYYTFFSDYHEGQWSRKYARLCKILQYYKPSPMFRGYDGLSEESQMIYDDLAVQQAEE